MGDIRSKLRALVLWPVLTAVDVVSWPLFVFDFFKRHAGIRLFVFWFLFFSVAVIFGFGLGAWIGIVTFVGRFAFMMLFMIGQFVVLFTFLSSTKTIESYPGDKGAVNFKDDYYGNEYLVQAVREWVDSLSLEGKKKLDSMGAEAINGIMLEGPPGTGKTLLAQCLATDSNAAFYGTSGSDYQAMFIGVGPMKIMRMYSKARKAAKQWGAAIIFIDEIDAIGGNRGGVSGNQPVSGGLSGGMFGGGGLGVLSKLLTELDGVKEISRRDKIRNRVRRKLGIPPIPQGLVITIGATNRFASLDSALTRPGRIDKIIRVSPPDKNSRRSILNGYLKKVSHDKGDIDLEGMVEDTAGVTPAQIASAIQRSAPRYAINDGRDFITQADIDSAFQEDLVGLANPIQDFDPDQEWQVAVHEAGHALVARLVRPDKRITNVSIIRRGSGILGYVRDVETKEVFAMPLSRIAANVMVSVAGHEAVQLVLKEAWTGASSDFEHVRFYLRQLALSGQFGGIPFQMGIMGGDVFASERIRERADAWLRDAIKGTRTLLKENEPKLIEIAEALVENKELNSRDFLEIMPK